LDFVVEGIEALELPVSVTSLHASLIAEIDALAESYPHSSVLNGHAVRKLIRKRSWVERYTRLKELAQTMAKGQSPTPDELMEFELLFDGEVILQRLQILHEHRGALQFIDPLLRALWPHDIFVLSAGSIEAYYPPIVQGADKPSRALEACAKLTCPSDFASFCPLLDVGGGSKLEIEHYLESIVGDA
jgi:hypothetical protein